MTAAKLGMRILVVDDDSAERQHVKMLASGLGYEVAEAENGVGGARSIERRVRFCHDHRS